MLAPNTLLQSRYLIERKLGQGGMGAVYQAVDKRFDTTVALKQTLVRDENLRKAFEREARLLNKLRHAALPHVIDYFSEGENEFLVMQFIPGDDLAALLEKNGRPFPADQVLTWADQILAALAYLHGHEPPIVHRDIKPQNLKLTPQGEVILLDFGLSKGSAVDVSAAGGMSVAGYTPHFAPLEQIRGAGTNPRSDLYSLAATMYLLLTGSMPPDALERASAMLGGRPDPLRPLHEVNPAVPPSVSQVLFQALSQAPENRWATAAAMRNALKDAGKHDTARTMAIPQVTTVPDRSNAMTGPPPPNRPPSGPPPAPTSPGYPQRPMPDPNAYRTGPGVFNVPGPSVWPAPQGAAPASYPPPSPQPMRPVMQPPSGPGMTHMPPSMPQQKTRGLAWTMLALWLTVGFFISLVAGVIVAMAIAGEDPPVQLSLIFTLFFYVVGAIVFIFIAKR